MASRGGPSDRDPLRAKTATILDRDGRPTIESVRDDPTLADDFAAAAARATHRPGRNCREKVSGR